MKNNSLAITLFYGGIGCSLFGVIGLGTVVFLFFRGHSRDDKEIIFQEIQEAENRQAPHHISSTPQLMITPGRSQAVGPDPRRGSPQRPARERDRLPSPEALMPSKKDPNAPIVPMAASIYTEEFSLNEQEQQPAPVRPMASRLRQTAHQQAPAEKPPVQAVEKPKERSAEKPAGQPVEKPMAPKAEPVQAPQRAAAREEPAPSPKPVSRPEKKADPPPEPPAPTQTLPTLEIPQVQPKGAKKEAAPIRPQPMPEETIEWTAERAKPKPAKKAQHKVSAVEIPEEAIPTGRRKKRESGPVYQQESLFDSAPSAPPETPPAAKEDEELPGQMNLF